MNRKIFDCGQSIAIAYPGNGVGHGIHNQGRVHLSPVPRPGVALSHGVHIEGERALRALRDAIDHALTIDERL